MAAGCATRVRDTQKGERAVLLIHGYLESLDVWEEFTKLLSPSARVVSIDLPGHGISEIKGDEHSMAFLADVVAAAMREMGVEKPLVVGHSMGGYVSLEVIKRHPELASGLVLFHSSPNPDSEKKRTDRDREIELILSGKKELLARMFPQVGFAPQNRERLHAEIEDMTEQIILTEDAGIVAILRGMRDRADNNETLRAYARPKLAIFGRYDEYITPEVGEAVIAAQPGLETVWLENSGHMGFIEEPVVSAEIILDFLGRV